MGNYISCSLTLRTPLIKSSKAARVVLPSGEVRQFREPIKAAELMLECPNSFLTNSLSLHIGRRFSALGADEELEIGNVYIMFPMKRVNSVVTGVDMTMLFMAANSAGKRISGSTDHNWGSMGSGGGECEDGRIDYRKGESELGLVTEGMELDGRSLVPEFEYRLGVCRSKKPLLETIREEAVWIKLIDA